MRDLLENLIKYSQFIKMSLNDQENANFLKTFCPDAYCTVVWYRDVGTIIGKTRTLGLGLSRRKITIKLFKNVSKWVIFLWQTQIQTIRYGFNAAKRIKKETSYIDTLLIYTFW